MMRPVAVKSPPNISAVGLYPEAENAVSLTKLLVERVKPHAVFPERSSQRPAELVSLQVLSRGSKEASGVQDPVAEELENLAMVLVAPALGDDVDDGGTCPLIRHQEIHLYLELIDGSDGRAEREFAISRSPDVEAVERVADRVRKRTGQDNEPSGRPDIRGKHIASRADLVDASGQQSQLKEVAAIQREFPNLFGIHQRTDGIGLRVQFG